jgi:hypothetical protein
MVQFVPTNAAVDVFCERWSIPLPVLRATTEEYARLGRHKLTAVVLPAIIYLVNNSFHWGPNLVDISLAFNIHKPELYRRARALKLDPVHHHRFLEHAKSVGILPLGLSAVRRVQQIARFHGYSVYEVTTIRKYLAEQYPALTPSIADGVALLRAHPSCGPHIVNLVGRTLSTVQKWYRTIYHNQHN